MLFSLLFLISVLYFSRFVFTEGKIMAKFKNSTYIFTHRLIKGFADAVVKLFIPLLIFQATNNMMLSLLYCIISYGVAGILFFALKKFITRFPILCIIIQIVPLLAVQFLINNITIFSIIAIAVIDAISLTLYYGGLNLLFGLHDETTNTAKFESAEHFGKIFFITLGAIVLGEIHNSLLLVTIFASVMYIISVIPLIANYKVLTKNVYIVSNSKPAEILKDTMPFNLYHICCAALNFFATTFLPLYLFSQGLSFTTTGSILVLQEIMFVGGAYASKLFTKIKQEKLFIILSSVIIGICIILIWLLSNTIVIYILTLVISFFFQGIFVLMLQLYIVDQKKKGYFQDAIFYRDVFQNFSRTTTCGMYMIGLFAPIMFVLGIILSGGFCYTSLKCLDKSKEEPKN